MTPAIDWENAPEWKEPTAFENVLEAFWRDMEDEHSHKIGFLDGSDVYAVTVELGHLAAWFDKLQEVHDKEVGR